MKKRIWSCFLFILMLTGTGCDKQQETYVQDKTDPMEPYYGYYEIIEFCTGGHMGDEYFYKNLPKQEVDMMVGKTISIQKDNFQTYNSDRKEGSIRMVRNEYEVSKHEINDPKYIVNDRMEGKTSGLFWGMDDNISYYIGDVKFGEITNRIMISQFMDSQCFYTLENSDELILYLTDMDRCFLLKKIDQVREEKVAESIPEKEAGQILDKFYGSYQVTKFLPTEYYPVMDSIEYDSDYFKLPQQEAEMMIGKEVIITEAVFRGYDNYRAPSSYVTEREKEDYWLKEAVIESPGYQVSVQLRKDIYGLRDTMLPEKMVQEQYIEIKTEKSYGDYTQRFPKFYVLQNGNVMMLCMNEYFLLEKEYTR